MSEIKLYSDTALALLKANLGFFSTAIPEDVSAYLKHLLEYAYLRLDETANIHLVPGNLYDDQLQVIYAAWLYRKGGEGSAPPPMVRQAIRDYQVSTALASCEGEFF